MSSPVNPILARPIDAIIAELHLNPLGPAAIALRDMITRVDKALTDLGEVQNVANVKGRTEQIQTTLQNVTSVGKLTNTDAIAADGTGSPLTGGRRGFVALDTNNRLANSFRANPVNVSNTPTSTTTLSNDGVSTSIPITAYTSQFPAGSVSYNSGSVDPGAFQKSFVYFDDSTFAGGAVTYQFTATAQNQTAAEGRCIVGSITTTGGSAKTGGGNQGGTGGSGGGRGYIPA